MDEPTSTPFPRLPALGDLVLSDPAWSYPATTRTGGYAHLRLFTVPDGGHFALVTDQGLGTSVTNAAEHIHTTLTSEFGEPLWMIEHYPASRNLPDDGDTLDLVDLVGTEPVWRPIWPYRFGTSGYDEAAAWMRDHGYRMLAA